MPPFSQEGKKKISHFYSLLELFDGFEVGFDDFDETVRIVVFESIPDGACDELFVCKLNGWAIFFNASRFFLIGV